MGEVQASAGYLTHDVGEQRDVPPDGGRLRRPGPAAEAEDRGDDPVIRLRALGQGRVLGVVHERQPEHPRIRERVAEERRRTNRRAVVAEPDDAGIGQLAEEGELISVSAHRDGAVGEQRDRRARGRRRVPDPGEDRRLIEGRAWCSASRRRS